MALARTKNAYKNSAIMKCLREFQRENRNFIKILAQTKPKLQETAFWDLAPCIFG
jgi:hypothetical protein